MVLIAISYQLSAISYQLSAISYQLAAECLHGGIKLTDMILKRPD